ncbi:protein kinase [Streptomyces sp. NPDC005322]|uniref:protein kinase domain-containing protein n=1 Tax=Streptomyces sp. NPDC005322 TaxID=3157032 RepID=UPI0033B8FBD1
MEEYAGRVLADRYRLPLPPADEYDFVETRALDTYSGQEVHLRQIPLPEVVDAEVVGEDGRLGGRPPGSRSLNGAVAGGGAGAGVSGDPAVRRAILAATAAARIPDHPRLGQVFHVFAESGSLWIVSELVAGRPLAALLAEGTLTPHRATEVANDILTALRALHATGWIHRNITARTVLLCEDGRAMLTGLAAGAAEEALCGYDPVPVTLPAGRGSGPAEAGPPPEHGGHAATAEARSAEGDGQSGGGPVGPRYQDQGAAGGFAAPGASASSGAGAGASSDGGGRGPGGGFRVPDAGSGAQAPTYGAPGAGGGFAAPERVGHAAVPEARSAEGDGPVGAGPTGPRYRDQGPAGGFPASAPGAQAQVPPYGDRGAGNGFAVPGRGGDAGLPEDGATDDDGPVGPWYRDQGTAGGFPAPGAGSVPQEGPTYRDQGAAGGFPGPRGASDLSGGSGLPGPRRPGHGPGPALNGASPGVPGAREDTPVSGGGPGDAEGAASRAARASAIAAYAAGARAAAARANVDRPAAPGVHPDPTPAPGGGRWAGAPHHEETPVPWPKPAEGSGSWDTGGAAERGPATALAAERARQARIVVVGAVTERWAPEQAGPVHENWQLAPPVGPAADLWALGVLLFRAVQGHAPYPEESAAELVQMVCAEAPAYAEECGPLRPVVESLMRQDPTERPDSEELRGWLRSLIRSAPEPDVGSRTVTVPSIGPGGASDPRRLPIVRRRGWLVRKGRGRRLAGPTEHGRHKRAKRQEPSPSPSLPRPQPRQRSAQEPAEPKPRRLGRVLLLLILLALAAAVLYAMMFMPRDKDTGSQDRTGTAGAQSAAPTASEGAPADPKDPQKTADGDAQEPQSTTPAGLAKGFEVRKDPKGFKVAVHKDWTRRGENARGQIRYTGGDFELVVVAGRDKESEFGGDPMAYQQDREAELAAFRSSSWASSSGLRRIDVGRTAMAEGEFSWRDSSGRSVYARNLAMLIDGRYHVVLLIGPFDERRAVTHYFEQATATYSTTG